MYRKILVGGATAAVVLGAGTAALATTGSDTTAGTPAASSSSSTHARAGKASAGKAGQKHKRSPLRRAAHADITVKTKKGYVTRDLINGTVTSVSASSITVQAGDKTTETFVVGKDTRVVTRAATKGAKPTASSISEVTKGQHVVVTGVGTSTPAAKHIVDLGTK